MLIQKVVHSCEFARTERRRWIFLFRWKERVESGAGKLREMGEYENFADYREPFPAGEGPLGTFVAGLDPARRAKADDAERVAYEAGQPDGPPSIAAVAWACRRVTAL